MCRTPQPLGPSLVQQGGDQANGYPSKDITANTTTQKSDTIKALSLIESPMNHCQDDGDRIEYFYQQFNTVFQRLSFLETGLQVPATAPSLLVGRKKIKGSQNHSKMINH